MNRSNQTQAGEGDQTAVSRSDEKGSPEIPVELRRLASPDDFARAVELQRVTWGDSFRDLVPAAMLKVTQKIGGVTAGAFDGRGELVGFVYGLSGFRDNQLIHWSHMLAVKPDLRDHGVGRRLKEFQREQLVAAGIDWIYWTVDPLVARNAHLNLNRLHVQIRDYVPDMYGDTGSNLHAFGTDRFVVAWPVSGESAHANRRVRDGERAGLWETAILNGLDEQTLETLFLPSARPCTVRVEIPNKVEALGIAEAFAWRTATRRSFLTALRAGYEVSGFCCSGDGRCFYLMSVRADVLS
ncbi:MAG: hypothetical protein ACREMA_11210, partial [Longimicrobiales bacterium]